MRLVIITSNHLRHRFYANSLARNFNIVGLIEEDKKRDPSKKGQGTEDEPLVKKFFEERAETEEEFFGNEKDLLIKKDKVKVIPAGSINEKDVIEQIFNWDPDHICVFGSSLIGEEIVSRYNGRIINMHLGLSPYYRGSGTNFWPLYEGKPEYVGVTIHNIDLGIDTGEIIAQVRPEIDEDDTPHTIGNKTIQKGVEILVKVLKKIENGEEIRMVPQEKGKGKLYLFKDCEPKHIIELDKKFKDGTMREVLKNVNNKKVKIVEL